MTVAEELAGLALGQRFEGLRVEACESAMLCIADALGAGAVTATRASGDRVRARLQAVAADGAGAVIGDVRRVAARDAAWANGVLMHGEDFDDSPHTSYYLPALLAGTDHPLPGTELMAGWVAAYQVWMLLVHSARMTRPVNPTSVVAPIAAAAGVARLRRLDLRTTARALTIAASASAGLRGQFGTDMKGMDAGRSAAAGIEAVDLAVAGWTADDVIFERRNGWAAAFGDDWSFDEARAVMTGDPVRFPLRGKLPDLKPWPACLRHVLPLHALLAARSAMPAGTRIAGIRVEVGFDPAETAAFRDAPRTPLEAKFSMPYVMTAAALDGDIVPETFDDAAFARITGDPLYRNVEVVTVAARGRASAAARLILGDGTVIEREQGPATRMTRADVLAKLRAGAGRLLPADEADRVTAMAAALESASDVDDILIRLAVPPARPNASAAKGDH